MSKISTSIATNLMSYWTQKPKLVDELLI